MIKKMSVKTFIEINNYIYFSIFILTLLSINNKKLLFLFPPLIIGGGLNYFLCSYYKLTKITKYQILRLFIGFLGIFLIVFGVASFIYEIYFFI